MPEKQKTRDWKEVRTIVAAFAMTLLLTLWNLLANQDRHKTHEAQNSTGAAIAANNSTEDCSPLSLATFLNPNCKSITATRSS